MKKKNSLPERNGVLKTVLRVATLPLRRAPNLALAFAWAALEGLLPTPRRWCLAFNWMYLDSLDMEVEETRLHFFVSSRF